MRDTVYFADFSTEAGGMHRQPARAKSEGDDSSRSFFNGGRNYSPLSPLLRLPRPWSRRGPLEPRCVDSRTGRECRAAIAHVQEGPDVAEGHQEAVGHRAGGRVLEGATGVSDEDMGEDADAKGGPDDGARAEADECEVRSLLLVPSNGAGQDPGAADGARSSATVAGGAFHPLRSTSATRQASSPLALAIGQRLKKHGGVRQHAGAVSIRECMSWDGYNDKFAYLPASSGASLFRTGSIKLSTTGAETGSYHTKDEAASLIDSVWLGAAGAGVEHVVGESAPPHERAEMPSPSRRADARAERRERRGTRRDSVLSQRRVSARA